MKETLDDLHEFSVDWRNREIYLQRHHNNSEDDDIESRMASKFIKNLRALDAKNSHILIHLSAGGGGEWEQGMAIYDAISFTQSYVTILIYGSACSMSSIIPQAADVRIMMPHSYMMCHYGSETVADSHNNNKRYFQFCNKFMKNMVEIYSNKMKDSLYVKEREPKDNLKYAKSLIERKLEGGDWYLSPEDAVYYGLADDVLGSEDYPNMKALKHG